MRKKYWNPDCEKEDKKHFEELKKKVDKERAKEGKPPFKTTGALMSSLIRVGNKYREELVSI